MESTLRSRLSVLCRDLRQVLWLPNLPPWVHASLRDHIRKIEMEMTLADKAGVAKAAVAEPPATKRRSRPAGTFAEAGDL